ncbi:MAG: DNA methyltransferase [Polyangiaceae bacterium]
MKAPPRERRALSHVATPKDETDAVGPRKLASLLKDVFSAASREELSEDGDDEAVRAHVHGFHSYPARMHPSVAREALLGLAPKQGVVLDPFCGGGTVLVEGRIDDQDVIGVDANPLAVRLAELKATGRSSEQLDALVEGARRVAAFADERRKARSGASRRFPPDDVALFAPHVLLELDGLRLGIDREKNVKLRADLELVLSAILTKVSRKLGDSSEKSEEKRIAAGYTAKLLVRKADELAQRVEEFVAKVPRNTPPPIVLEGDARELAGVDSGSVDLVLTSPPYPGNYDYLSHHAARLRWLRMDASSFDSREVGARRHLENPKQRDPIGTWRNDVAGFLKAMRRVLRPDGCALLIIADSVVGDQAVFIDDLVRDVAPSCGMDLVARASQQRPHFHGPTQKLFRQRPRREHALYLEPVAEARPQPKAGVAKPRTSAREK